jgi:hypothetical protein
MTLRLGELLLKEKMITLDQLDEALKSQVFYGIKLGSSLIELGYITETALAKLLSDKLGVPCVSRKELDMVPKELIQDFPRQIVERFHIFPFGFADGQICVAMSDPTDLRAIDEIGFATGYRVKAFIAPDIQISRAQATYFNITRGEARYQQAASQHKKTVVADTVQQPVAVSNPFAAADELLNVSLPTAVEETPKASKAVAGFAHTVTPTYTVDQLSRDFAAARNREDVANVFITYLGQEFSIGALFIIRGTVAVGWRAVSGGERIAGFSDFCLMMSKSSILRDVVESRNYMMGTLISTTENRQILKVLCAPSEASLVAVPVVMLKKVVAVVLVSADTKELEQRLSDLHTLVRKASLAFEMLIIKNKILLT